MVDIQSVSDGVTLIGTAQLMNSELIKRVLGPTADYVGGEIKGLVEKRIGNLKQIFSKADKKIIEGKRLSGSVPPKVISGIINSASFCEDELSADYFGGVLASSKSEVTRDDRGAAYISLLSRLSTYEIRTHFIIYKIIKCCFDGTDLDFGSQREKMKLFIPFSVYYKAMDFNELEDLVVIIENTIIGLAREGLIENYSIGKKEHIQRKYFANATQGGVVINPSPLGVQLFLWAHGRAELRITDFFDTRNQFTDSTEIFIPEGYLILS